jgi:hypothetical protein
LRRVIVESPYAGDVARNLRYLRACLHDCLMRDEAPFASHGLYTQAGVLDDEKPEERTLGIAAGLRWGAAADATVVYCDLGVSKGMHYGIRSAMEHQRPVEYRYLYTTVDRIGLADNEVRAGNAEVARLDGEVAFLSDKIEQLNAEIARLKGVVK